MERRNFLPLLAAVPFVEWLLPKPDPGIPYCGPVSIDDWVDIRKLGQEIEVEKLPTIWATKNGLTGTPTCWYNVCQCKDGSWRLRSISDEPIDYALAEGESIMDELPGR